MAAGIPNNEDLFTCPICLDLLKDPVTLQCGHNHCMDCITGCWDQEDKKGVYSCPQCRETFTVRPVLRKNNVIAEVVGQFREARFQIAAPGPAAVELGMYAGLGDVECDVCMGKKLKAVKSCLECLVSYCETHLKAHNDVILGRKHKVVDATGQLQERICTQHEKPLEIFCRTDQKCVCFLCMVDEHKGHDTVSASAGRKEKQTNLEKTQRKFQQRIQKREKEQQELNKAVEILKSSAATAVADSERIFTEMIHFIEQRHSEVTKLIRAQEKAEVSRAEGDLKRLEQEIAELKRRDAELEQLLHTEDHIHFLKVFQSVSDELKDSSSITINQSFSFETVKKSLSSLNEQLKDLYIQEIKKIKPFSFGTCFGAQSDEKIGEWQCPTCYVTNMASVSSCVACQTHNLSSKGDGGIPKGFSFSFGSSVSFAKTDGQWICDQCCARNEKTSLKCISCQSSDFGTKGGLASLFEKLPGQWDCDVCLTRNEGSARFCVACQAPNSSAKSSTTFTFSTVTPAFSFGQPANPLVQDLARSRPFQFCQSRDNHPSSS